jgi:hypothetical protein
MVRVKGTRMKHSQVTIHTAAILNKHAFELHNLAEAYLTVYPQKIARFEAMFAAAREAKEAADLLLQIDERQPK